VSAVAPPVSIEPVAVAAALPPDRPIGSLGRRILAFVVDAVLLGIAGNVVALPFFSPLSRIGPWGPLVGFFLALPYFAILNSQIGGGQTLGKRWLRLQVVDKEGNTIPLGRSVVRYTVFAVPYFMNGIGLPTSRVPLIVSVVIWMVVFGVGGATFYLVFFNRHSRQGIHDLAGGSYVADASKVGAPRIQPIWATHCGILTAIFVVFGVTTAALFKGPGSPLSELFEDIRLAESMPQVQVAKAQETLPWGQGEAKKILTINVFWNGKTGGERAFAGQVAKNILQNDPRAQNHDLLRVRVTRGYDLGIANAHFSYSFEHSPAEWNRVLATTSLQGQIASPKPE
jgi:uncharacterized RDD family membrane protein YckC